MIVTCAYIDGIAKKNPVIIFYDESVFEKSVPISFSKSKYLIISKETKFFHV